MFVGQYSVGDISYVGLKSVNNAHGLGFQVSHKTHILYGKNDSDRFLYS